MNEAYEIAPARRVHVPSLPPIERAAATLFPAEDLSTSERDETVPEADFEVASREGRLWVALLHDDPVGFALASRLDGHGHLEELAVHPDHGRRGLGAALVGRVCAWARGNGLGAVTLTTFRHLPFNAPFYNRLGFRILDASEWTEGLAEVLDDEADRGLANRVAMRLDLEASA